MTGGQVKRSDLNVAIYSSMLSMSQAETESCCPSEFIASDTSGNLDPNSFLSNSDDRSQCFWSTIICALRPISRWYFQETSLISFTREETTCGQRIFKLACGLWTGSVWRLPRSTRLLGLGPLRSHPMMAGKVVSGKGRHVSTANTRH